MAPVQSLVCWLQTWVIRVLGAVRGNDRHFQDPLPCPAGIRAPPSEDAGESMDPQRTFVFASAWKCWVPVCQAVFRPFRRPPRPSGLASRVSAELGFPGFRRFEIRHGLRLPPSEAPALLPSSPSSSRPLVRLLRSMDLAGAWGRDGGLSGRQYGRTERNTGRKGIPSSAPGPWKSFRHEPGVLEGAS
jgi:hypothetical protein